MATPRVEDERRTYWPRAGPAVPPPDFEDDRYCVNCGYNLRGLTYHDACPECGSEHGLSPSEEPLPWDERQTFLSFIATLFQILIEPSEFGSHVWRRGHLNFRAARRFRRINITIGASCLGAVMFVLLFDAIGIEAALLAWPMCMVSMLLWFAKSTQGRLRFFESENLLPRDPQRVRALVCYLSAPLALSPIQFAALYASRPAMMTGAWSAAVAIHGVLLLMQLLLASQAEAYVLWQVLDMPKAQARMMAVGAATLRILSGAFYCGALPALFALIANSIVHG
jgi:hypothetical protein